MRKKLLTVFLISLLLISTVTLTGCSDEGDENGDGKQVELEISGPRAHNGSILVKATLTGDQSSYRLRLPHGEDLGTGHIKEEEMADGEHTVWIPMEGDQSNPDLGEYNVSVLDFDHNKLAEKNFTYDGPNITINDADITWDTYDQFKSDLGSVTVNVSNSGDPGYFTKISVTINGTTDTSYIEEYIDESSEPYPIPAGSDDQITASSYILEPGNGSFEAEIELIEESGSTISTYNKTVNVP